MSDEEKKPLPIEELITRLQNLHCNKLDNQRVMGHLREDLARREADAVKLDALIDKYKKGLLIALQDESDE